MKILIINAGSSSLKLQLLDSNQNFLCLYKGFADRLNTKSCSIKENYLNHEEIFDLKNPTYKKTVKIFLDQILKAKIIENLCDIKVIGHRVVHGGEKYRNAIKLNKNIIKDIQKLSELAPLHNPPNIAGIEACTELLPTTPQFAVFDTAFHQTIPEKAFLYALPLEYYKKFNIRRYGFHGTSHAYLSQETNKLLNKKATKVITCHLGNGSSVTAIKNGISVDTSMGFTPLEGLPMGTRSGDIDPAIIFYLCKKLQQTPEQIENILNKESGLKGISTISSDVRTLWAASTKKNKKAKMALELLAYKIAKYIGSYTATLQGLDALTFSGGIGENAYYLRQQVCNYLSFLGLKLDDKKNKKNMLEISSLKSKIKVYVIPTNEEKRIAQEVDKLFNKNS